MQIPVKIQEIWTPTKIAVIVLNFYRTVKLPEDAETMANSV